MVVIEHLESANRSQTGQRSACVHGSQEETGSLQTASPALPAGDADKVMYKIRHIVAPAWPYGPVLIAGSSSSASPWRRRSCCTGPTGRPSLRGDLLRLDRVHHERLHRSHRPVLIAFVDDSPRSQPETKLHWPHRPVFIAGLPHGALRVTGLTIRSSSR